MQSCHMVFEDRGEPRIAGGDRAWRREYSWFRFWREGNEYAAELSGTKLTGQQIWDYVNDLGRDGWELVSVVGENTTDPESAYWNDMPYGNVATSRWMLWFKPKHQ